MTFATMVMFKSKSSRLDPWPSIAARAELFRPMFTAKILGARSGCYCHPDRPGADDDAIRAIVDKGIRDYMRDRERMGMDAMESESLCAAMHMAAETALADPMAVPEHAARAEAERCRETVRISIRCRMGNERPHIPSLVGRGDRLYIHGSTFFS